MHQNADDFYCWSKPSVSAVFLAFTEKFCCKISFLENCPEFSRIFTSRSRSQSILFSLCTSRKRVKASFFHFSLLELPRPTFAGACHVNADVLRFPKIWYF